MTPFSQRGTGRHRGYGRREVESPVGAECRNAREAPVVRPLARTRLGPYEPCVVRQDVGMSTAELGVFVFSEDPLPQAFRSLADAEAEMEAIDVESGEYKAVYTLDGRIVSAATADNRVVLKVTAERDEADLGLRLREWAKRAPELNDLLGDRVATANQL